MINGLRHDIEAEKHIIEYGTIVGDDDCRIGLKRGAIKVGRLAEDRLDSPLG